MESVLFRTSCGIISGRFLRIISAFAGDLPEIPAHSCSIHTAECPVKYHPCLHRVQFIGRKFTLYSILTIILSSIFVDILPAYVFTQDAMLNSVFGGLINGFAISLCLNVGTTTGGTDFISIYLSQRKGIDAWNYILFGNVMLLILAGYLFGWSIALYSIIFQFCSTQAIQILYKRYKKKHYLSSRITPNRSIKQYGKQPTTMPRCFRASAVMKKKRKL